MIWIKTSWTSSRSAKAHDLGIGSFLYPIFLKALIRFLCRNRIWFVKGSDPDTIFQGVGFGSSFSKGKDLDQVFQWVVSEII